ncbi:MAG: hypothetical protein WC383_06075 [Gammaproteobacteria bacterium]
MLNFNCPKCGNRMCAEDSKKGMLVRCPQCKSIVKTPDKPKSILDKVQASLASCSGKLKKLYSAVLEKYGELIVSSQVIGDDSNRGLLFVVKTGEDNSRKQIVCAFSIKSPLGQDDILGILSNICEVEDFAVDYDLILKHLEPGLMHLQIQDGTLQLYGAFPFDDCNYELKAHFIYVFADKADAIEDIITDSDNL